MLEAIFTRFCCEYGRSIYQKFNFKMTFTKSLIVWLSDQRLFVNLGYDHQWLQIAHSGKIQRWKPVIFKNFKYWNITKTVDFEIEMFFNCGRLKIFFPIILYIYLVAFGRICNYQVYWCPCNYQVYLMSFQWRDLHLTNGSYYESFDKFSSLAWIEVRITKLKTRSNCTNILDFS